MRGLWGTVVLLVVLAIGGLSLVRQLHAVGRPAAQGAAAEAPGSPVPLASAGGTVRDRVHAQQRQVADDVAKALQQGADARARAADAP